MGRLVLSSVQCWREWEAAEHAGSGDELLPQLRWLDQGDDRKQDALARCALIAAAKRPALERTGRKFSLNDGCGGDVCEHLRVRQCDAIVLVGCCRNGG